MTDLHRMFGGQGVIVQIYVYKLNVLAMILQ